MSDWKDSVFTQQELYDMVDALTAERDALKAQWIPVSEQWPDIGKDVLLYPGYRVGYCHPNGGWFTYLGAISHNDDDVITHWMPLPAPPQTEGR